MLQLKHRKIFNSMLVACVLVFLPITAFAQTNDPCKNLPELAWLEHRTKYFAIIFPEQDSGIGQQFSLIYGGQLDAEYSRFQRLFNYDLPVPISVRIYPTVDDFHCLNAIANPIDENTSHTHLGSREVVFIADNIMKDMTSWRTSFQNDFRFELASLFVEAITDDQSPPGLKVGVGLYAQDPLVLFGNQEVVGTGYSVPGQTWRYLWENNSTTTNWVLQEGALSTVAFLVDVYGWPKFISFLKILSTSSSYRQALTDIYSVESSYLEEQWIEYYPLYFSGRWRVHAIYDFDLTDFEFLIKNGAYTDAIDDLNEAIAFLEFSNQSDKLQIAQELLTHAKKGQAAGQLVSQSRRALQNHDYEKAIELGNQAESQYLEIEDKRRLEEIDIYRQRAQEILDIQRSLEELQKQIETERDLEKLAEQFTAHGRRMAELGDQEGVAIAQQAIENLNNRQKNEIVAKGKQIVLAVTGLLILRLLIILRKPPIEVL